MAVVYGACGEDAFSAVTCTDGQCPSGHYCSDGRCLPFGDECLVDPDCPLDAVCDFGVCVSAAACDDCGDDQLCDPDGPRCIQADGDCSARPCPQGDAKLAYVCGANDWCVASLRVASGTQLSVRAPRPFQLIESADDFYVEWNQVGDGAALLYLLDEPLEGDDVSLDSAVWAAAVEQGAERRVPYTSGHVVSDGAWGPLASELPPAGTYYLLVQELSPGQVLASSSPIILGIGEPVPLQASRCSDPGFPGDCGPAANRLACLDGACRRLCAADRDCADVDLVCGRFIDGYRACEPPPS